MNGTFHIIQHGGEEIWLDGENIERITKIGEDNDIPHYFYAEVVRKCEGVGFGQKPEIISCVAAIMFYPNTKEKQEL